jgi:predicted phosphate transport protein (TIGR00153 family)
MVFFTKHLEIHDQILEHLDKCLLCHERLTEYIEDIIGEGNEQKALVYVKEISAMETDADAIRRRIIMELLKGNLLPQSRREVLYLIEKIDEIANESEEIMRDVYLQAVELDDEYLEGLRAINEETRVQLKTLRMAVDKIFSDIWSENGKLNELLIEVDAHESHVDIIEQSIIKDIYRSGIPLAEKNQLRYFTAKFADISNLAEDISDLLERIIITRKV